MAKILICTGIYPPLVGGPSQYAKEVENELKKRGNDVQVLTYKLEHRLPTFVRHCLFFCRVLIAAPRADFILALDTFSVGLPATAAAKILSKKIVIRTGGDFLWETYVERTSEMVLLQEFYEQHRNFNLKDRVIFMVTKWTLKNSKAVIFSTDWQRKIFEKAYKLVPERNFIVENFYGPKKTSTEAKDKIFVSGGRPIKLKNEGRLKEAFELAKKIDPEIKLSLKNVPHDQFTEFMKSVYAVLLVSISDISPNMILEAIQYNKPFIVTKETGIQDRLKDVGIFVDPLNVEDIKEKILWLADKDNYEKQKQKIESFDFVHTWSDIAGEILDIVNKTK